MRRGGLLAAGLLATAGLAAPAASAHAPTATVFLDANGGPRTPHRICVAEHGCGPQVTAPVVLAQGEPYIIEVSGTVSPWNYWHDPCGTPEPVVYPTAGPQTPTGDDAMFRFAYHVHTKKGCPRLYRRTHFFQMNLGSGWVAPNPLGNPTEPAGGDHSYAILVTGEGQAPSFRYIDIDPADNSGAFRITVAPF